MSFRKKCGSSCPDLLCKHGDGGMELQQAGEDDIAKVVEGNVRWLRKAACVSQSVKRDLISSLALDRPQSSAPWG